MKRASTPTLGSAIELGAVAAVVGVGLWLRGHSFGAAWTHLDAAYPYIQGALEARGEAPPLAGAPAGFSLRHGAVNAWLSGPIVWSTRDSTSATSLKHFSLIPEPLCTSHLVPRLLSLGSFAAMARSARCTAPSLSVQLQRFKHSKASATARVATLCRASAWR